MISIRPAVAADEPFLRTVLAAAADWRPGSVVRSGDEVMEDPAIVHYLAGWPRPSDVGFVADDDGAAVGAVWWRYSDGDTHGYGVVADDVPELTIGVVADRRGEGVGRLLLDTLVAEARRRGIARISLSVEADNPAKHLYDAAGFVAVSGHADAPTMVLVTLPGHVRSASVGSTDYVRHHRHRQSTPDA